MIDNIATIKLSVEHGQLRLVKSVDATTQSVNTFQISFTFLSNEWNDMVKIATFFRKDMEPMSIIVDSDNSCLVPWEILDVSSTWHGDIIYDVGVIGSGVNGTRLTTNKVRLKMQPGSYADGQGSQPPTSTIFEQLSERIDALNDYSKEEILQFIEEYCADNNIATKDYVDSRQIKSDWNQNDDTNNDYIKNRTHYIETNKQFLTSGTWVLTLGGGTDLFILSKTGLNVESFIIGDIYELICIHNNGNTYKFKLKATQGDEIRARIIHSYGKTEQIDPSGADLAIQIIDGSLSIDTAAECNYLIGESSVEIYHIQENIHQIDPKYLPGKQIYVINTNDNMTSIDLTELESGLYYLDNSIEIPVLRQQDGEDVTYDYYFLERNSIISVSNFDSGGYIISFMYCYTFEWECDDFGNRVFLYVYANDGFGAENADELIGRQGVGNNAEIFNDYLNSTATGNYSHVEGYKGFGSGFAAHAEGDCCYASGPGTHAEGVGTMAEASAQHVQGQFNIPDEDWVYAHIVGNGFNDSNRSNAHTLDWSGNAWFAGDVYVGSTSGTNKDDGSKKLATEEYVDNHINIELPKVSSDDNGSFLRVVDGEWGVANDPNPYKITVQVNGDYHDTSITSFVDMSDAAKEQFISNYNYMADTGSGLNDFSPQVIRSFTQNSDYMTYVIPAKLIGSSYSVSGQTFQSIIVQYEYCYKNDMANWVQVLGEIHLIVENDQLKTGSSEEVELYTKQ